MSVEIHPTATVSQLADLEPSVRGTRIVIGAGAVVDSFVKIKPAGGTGDVVIGPRSIINAGSVIYSGNGVTIGADCAIAANCVFAATNHAYADRNRLIREQRFQPSRGGILVEDDVWIGAGTVLLDGAIVRRGAGVGAMSLVRGEVAPYSVQSGNPLAFMRWRT